MIEIIVGLCVIIGIILMVYLIGLIPNLWSSNIINPLSFSLIFERSFEILGKFVFFIICTTIILLILYYIGSIIKVIMTP